ncbi:MAG: hypothetical protein IPL60_04525 [Ardenticatenia bacterium]|nr:hypothetical protein [Ardenticatenia bacterium]
MSPPAQLRMRLPAWLGACFGELAAGWPEAAMQAAAQRMLQIRHDSTA